MMARPAQVSHPRHRPHRRVPRGRQIPILFRLAIPLPAQRIGGCVFVSDVNYRMVVAIHDRTVRSPSQGAAIAPGTYSHQTHCHAGRRPFLVFEIPQIPAPGGGSASGYRRDRAAARRSRDVVRGAHKFRNAAFGHGIGSIQYPCTIFPPNGAFLAIERIGAHKKAAAGDVDHGSPAGLSRSNVVTYIVATQRTFAFRIFLRGSIPNGSRVSFLGEQRLSSRIRFLVRSRVAIGSG